MVEPVEHLQVKHPSQMSGCLTLPGLQEKVRCAKAVPVSHRLVHQPSTLRLLAVLSALAVAMTNASLVRPPEAVADTTNATACGKPGAKLVLTDSDVAMRKVFKRKDCDLTDVTLTWRGVGAVVPESLETVQVIADGTTGSEELVVSASASGDVAVSNGMDETEAETSEYQGSLPHCPGGNYRSYYPTRPAWRAGPAFRVNANTHPLSITREQWVAGT